MADNAEYLPLIADKGASVWLFQVLMSVAALGLAVFGAGLRRRLDEQEPVGSLARTLALVGLLLAAGLCLVGGGISTELFWQLENADKSDPDTVLGNVAHPQHDGVGVGRGRPDGGSGGVGRAHATSRSGGRLAWFSAVMAGLIGVAQLVPLQYLAALPGALWCLVAGIAMARTGPSGLTGRCGGARSTLRAWWRGLGGRAPPPATARGPGRVGVAGDAHHAAAATGAPSPPRSSSWPAWRWRRRHRPVVAEHPRLVREPVVLPGRPGRRPRLRDRGVGDPRPAGRTRSGGSWRSPRSAEGWRRSASSGRSGWPPTRPCPSCSPLPSAQQWGWVPGTLALVTVVPWLVRDKPARAVGRAGRGRRGGMTASMVVVRVTDPYPWPHGEPSAPFPIRSQAWVDLIESAFRVADGRPDRARTARRPGRGGAAGGVRPSNAAGSGGWRSAPRC